MLGQESKRLEDEINVKTAEINSLSAQLEFIGLAMAKLENQTAAQTLNIKASLQTMEAAIRDMKQNLTEAFETPIEMLIRVVKALLESSSPTALQALKVAVKGLYQALLTGQVYTRM